MCLSLGGGFVVACPLCGLVAAYCEASFFMFSPVVVPYLWILLCIAITLLGKKARFTLLFSDYDLYTVCHVVVAFSVSVIGRLCSVILLFLATFYTILKMVPKYIC